MGALRISEFMRRYGCGRSKTYLLIGDGKIRAKKADRCLLIDAQSAEDWFNSLPDAKLAGSKPRTRQ